jgi:3-oxoacyl-[acyl-carrier protein] reductase
MPDLRFAAPKERRVSVITGGSRGIGRAAALRIAEEGRDIVIADVLAEEGSKTVADIEALGQKAIYIETDVSDEAAVHAAVDATIERGWGRCVSITSGARVGSPNHVPYSVSKAAVFSFVGSLGGAWPKENVFVNGVEPGRALTDMVVPRCSEEHIKNPGIPIGRYSDANELAEVIEFLCSERNTYTSGAVWSVKGQTG